MVLLMHSSLGIDLSKLTPSQLKLVFENWTEFHANYQAERGLKWHKCPMLWCPSSFNSAAELLKHVSQCPDSCGGWYWCQECEKPEYMSSSNCDSAELVARRFEAKQIRKFAMRHRILAFLLARARSTFKAFRMNDVLKEPAQERPKSTAFIPGPSEKLPYYDQSPETVQYSSTYLEKSALRFKPGSQNYNESTFNVDQDISSLNSPTPLPQYTETPDVATRPHRYSPDLPECLMLSSSMSSNLVQAASIQMNHGAGPSVAPWPDWTPPHAHELHSRDRGDLTKSICDDFDVDFYHHVEDGFQALVNHKDHHASTGVSPEVASMLESSDTSRKHLSIDAVISQIAITDDKMDEAEDSQLNTSISQGTFLSSPDPYSATFSDVSPFSTFPGSSTLNTPNTSSSFGRDYKNYNTNKPAGNIGQMTHAGHTEDHIKTILSQMELAELDGNYQPAFSDYDLKPILWDQRRSSVANEIPVITRPVNSRAREMTARNSILVERTITQTIEEVSPEPESDDQGLRLQKELTPRPAAKRKANL
ncbi:hypothetical protein MMC25_004892 [Agyrium rufum]|nr:hypothetical protein [Agyrium rufum]